MKENKMYEQALSDIVKEINSAPQAETGAPMPEIIAGEGRLSLFYMIAGFEPNWEGKWEDEIPRYNQSEKIAVVSFTKPYAHFFGPPNDEALSGHPLYKKGLQQYSISEIEKSTWISQLEKMNSVHPYHDKSRFECFKHFIFTFHDSTVECIAEGFVVKTVAGSIQEAMLNSFKS